MVGIQPSISSVPRVTNYPEFPFSNETCFSAKMIAQRTQTGGVSLSICHYLNKVIIDLLLLKLRFNDQISLQLGKKVKTKCIIEKVNACISKTVVRNYVNV